MVIGLRAAVLCDWCRCWVHHVHVA